MVSSRAPGKGHMAIHIRRRECIVTLSGAATWPVAAVAQRGARVLRVGFVGVQPSDAPIYVAFRKRMAELGIGRTGTSSSNTSKLRASTLMMRAFANSPLASLTL